MSESRGPPDLKPPYACWDVRITEFRLRPRMRDIQPPVKRRARGRTYARPGCRCHTRSRPRAPPRRCSNKPSAWMLLPPTVLPPGARAAARCRTGHRTSCRPKLNKRGPRYPRVPVRSNAVVARLEPGRPPRGECQNRRRSGCRSDRRRLGCRCPSGRAGRGRSA